MSEPLREDCPRCGADLRHEEGWAPGRVAYCTDDGCRFEGIESPIALLARWVRRRLGRGSA